MTAAMIVAMSPQDAMHSNVIQILTTILVPKLLDRAYVRADRVLVERVP